MSRPIMRSVVIAAASLFVATSVAVAQEAEQGPNTYDIALIRWDAGDIFFNGVQYGEERQMEAIEAATGDTINFKVVAANDVATQLDGLRDLMAQGIDGVSLVPWKGEGLVQIVEELQAEGIPVVTHNLTVPGQAAPFVAFANQDAGRLAGEAIEAELIRGRGEDWGADGGVIMLLRGNITNSFDRERDMGYREVFDRLIEQFPGVEIVERADLDYAAEPARKAVEDAITRYGIENILAVASVDGTMAVGGAIPAIKTAGGNLAPDTEDRIAVTSIDCSKPELDAISGGDLTHCSEQPAIAEGILVQNLLYDMMSNGTLVPSEGAEAVEGAENAPWAPVEVLTRDDIVGPWYKTQAFAVPGQLPVEADGHWGSVDISGG